MGTSQQKQTSRFVAHAMAAAVAASLLGACTSEKKETSDGGSARPDAGRDSGLVDSGREDSAIGNDGGAEDAGKLDGSAAPPDAAILDPITAGNDDPTLTKIGFYNDELGPRVLILGRDPNGDIASYTIKFFNGESQVGFNIDNDTDTPDVTEFSNTITPVPNEAGFFLTVDQTEEFVAVVKDIKVVVTDAGGRKSNELSATLRTVPAATSKCNTYGFDRCSGTNVCTKLSTTYAHSGDDGSCRPLASARMSACTAALTLAPPAITSVSGRVQTPSLWDPHPGCANATLRPDRVVKLKLTADAAKVVLSTNNANTNIDTVVYQLTSCTTQPPACVDENCPCVDDILAMGSEPRVNRSRLELRNLPKGDHLFVVDSQPVAGSTGDWFELTVTVE